MKKRKRSYFFAADYNHRIIWLEGVICSQSEQRVLRALKKMNKTKGPICFYISGPGGVFVSVFSIGKALVASLNPVLGIAHGKVQSACFLLTQYFKVCAAVPGTRFSFHHATTDGPWDKSGLLTQEEAINTLEYMRRADAIQALLFLHKTKKEHEVHRLFEGQKTISARTARCLGLIDCYLDQSDFNKDRRLIAKKKQHRTA